MTEKRERQRIRGPHKAAIVSKDDPALPDVLPRFVGGAELQIDQHLLNAARTIAKEPKDVLGATYAPPTRRLREPRLVGSRAIIASTILRTVSIGLMPSAGGPPGL